MTVSSFAVLKATGVFDYRSFFGLLKNDRIAATVNGENIYQGIVDAKKESYKTLSIMLNDETLDIPEEAEADFRKKSNMTESDILYTFLYTRL